MLLADWLAGISAVITANFGNNNTETAAGHKARVAFSGPEVEDTAVVTIAKLAKSTGSHLVIVIFTPWLVKDSDLIA